MQICEIQITGNKTGKGRAYSNPQLDLYKPTKSRNFTFSKLSETRGPKN